MPYALSAVRRRPARAAATMAGIGLATSLVVVLLSLSAGISSSAERLATASGVDLLATSGNTSLTGELFPPVTSAHSLSSKIPGSDPNVATASPWLLGELVFGNASLQAAANRSAVPPGWSPTSAGVVGWIPGANAGIETPSIVSGSGFTSAADPHWANGTYSGPSTHEIVLDTGLAGVLHVDVGSSVWASDVPVAGPSELASWFANATRYTVVGLSGPFWLVPSALLAFAYLSELQSLDGGAAVSSDQASLILIHLKDPTQASSDRATLAAAFPRLTVFTLANILSAVGSAVDLYRTFGTLVGAVGVVVAGLFTTNVLLMSVEDRKREFALLRAVGYPPRSIGATVVEEGALLAAGGLLVGLAGGYLGSIGMSRVLNGLVSGLPSGFSFVEFDAGVLLGALAVVVALAILASLAPAAYAMRLPVASELRAP